VTTFQNEYQARARAESIFEATSGDSKALARMDVKPCHYQLLSLEKETATGRGINCSIALRFMFTTILETKYVSA
jgi:hypothetical protein